MNREIFFVSETFPLGGTSTFAINICKGLEAVTSWRGTLGAVRRLSEMGEEAERDGLRVVGPRKKSLLHEERLEDLYRYCQKLRPKVVVATLSAGSFDFLRCVPEGVLRVGMIQSDDEPFYVLVERYLPWLDAIVGVSAENCRKIRERIGKSKVPIYQQAYGVPMPSTWEPKSFQDNLRVIYLGRVIEEQKRASLMAEVMERSLECSSKIIWTIAGDGPDLSIFREKFQHHPRVKLLGSLGYKDVPKVLAEQDVYFLCSDYEGLPLSLLEAMGRGLVPVVSDLPSGISEVVREHNGFKVSIDNPEGYVEALLSLVGDRNKLQAMSAFAAAQVMSDYSIEAMAKRWVSMVEERLVASEPDWSRFSRGNVPLDCEGRLLMHPTLRPLRKWWKSMWV